MPACFSRMAIPRPANPAPMMTMSRGCTSAPPPSMMTSGHMTSGHHKLWPTDFFGALRGLGHVWVRYYSTHPTELALTAAANLEMDPSSRSAVRTVVNRHYVEFLRPLLDDARSSGQLRPDADVDAFLALL